MERDARFQSHLLHVSRSPQYTRSNNTKSHLPLKVPSQGAPSAWSPNGTPMDRDALFPEPMVHSFIHISQSPQLMNCPTKRENIWSPSKEPTWTEGVHTMGWGLVPQGDCVWHFCYYPSVMQLSAQYQPPWLQQTRALLAGTCHSNPHQSTLSTPVTTSDDPGYSSPQNPEVWTRDGIYRRLLHSILLFFWLILLLTNTTKLLLCVGNVSKLDYHIYFICSSKNNIVLTSSVRSGQQHTKCMCSALTWPPLHDHKRLVDSVLSVFF